MLKKLKEKKVIISKIITGLFLTTFILISYYSRNYEGIFSYVNSTGKAIYVLLFACLSFALCMCLVHFLFKFLDRLKSDFMDLPDVNSIIDKLFCRDLLKNWLVFIVCYLPYYIVYFPGITGADCDDMIHQFFGLRSATTFILDIKDNEIFINNHHPVFDTVLVGSFCKIGQMLGDINIGFAIYSTLQVLFVTFASACLIRILFLLFGEKLKVFRILVFINLAVNPLFVMYSLNLGKDTLYMLAIVALFIAVLEIIISAGNCFHSMKFNIFLGLSLLFTMLTKNQGKYIVVVLAFIIFCFNIKYFKQIFLIFGLALFAFVFLYQGMLFSSLGIKKGLKGEMLTIPAQQTARYLLEYGEDTTELEMQLFEKVFDVEYMLEKYKPFAPGGCRKSKDAYKRDATKQDLYEFIKIWVKWGLRHPDVYVDALTDSVYLYFDPIRGDDGYDFKMYTEFSEDEIANGFDLHCNETFRVIRELYEPFHDNYKNIPVVSILISPGLLMWIFVILFMWYFARIGFDRILILDAYVGLLFATAIASPVNGSTRYTFPLFYIMPVVFAFFITYRRLKGKNNKCKSV